jgi:hypothetical protein
LLGSVRAATVEAENYRKAAAEHATEAGLARTRALEHGSALEARLKDATEAATRATDLAKEADKNAKLVAKRSDHVQGAVEHADKSTAAIQSSTDAATAAKDVAEKAAKESELAHTGIEALLVDLQSRRDSIAPIFDEVTNARTTLDDAVASAANAKAAAEESLASAVESAKQSAEKCKHVSDGETYILDQRAQIAQHALDAAKQAEGAEASATDAEKAAAATASIRDQAETAQTEAEQYRDAAKAALDAAKKDADSTARLAKVSEEVEERIATYEKRLEALKAEFEATKATILGLLPAATSTGLAAAFHAQRAQYTWPRRLWTLAFFGAIAGLLAVGGIEIVQNWTSSAPSYDQLLRSLLGRLPIMAGLLWLGLLAASRSRMAGQIEETYAHKEAVSRSFEGYKREFASLGIETPAGASVEKLCERVIEAISTPPGHVYDTQKKDPTPVSAAVEAAGPILDKFNELAETLAKIKK